MKQSEPYHNSGGSYVNNKSIDFRSKLNKIVYNLIQPVFS